MRGTEFGNCGAHLVKNILGGVSAEPLDRPLLQRKQGHEMLPDLPKSLRVFAAANGIVVFQDAFRKARATEINIAHHRQLR